MSFPLNHPAYCDVIRRRIDEVYQQTPGTLFAEVK